ncbi:mitochondrial amidoxime reducing component 2-like protein [Tanacetum coccineum]
MDELKVSLCTPPQTCDGVSVWEWSGSALDEGQEASEWFTRYLGKPSRLVRFNQVSKGSLDSLNELLSEPVPINRFRPNILVDGCEPFSEDLWKEIKIGNLTFHGVKLCPRCKVPTINQENALSASEPLKTIVKFRFGKVLIQVGRERKVVKFVSSANFTSVYFGQNMVCEDLHEGNENIIRLEDPVDLEGHTASYGNKMYQILLQIGNMISVNVSKKFNAPENAKLPFESLQTTSALHLCAFMPELQKKGYRA